MYCNNERTKENLEKMKNFWENEIMASRDIAMIFGISRNALIGLAYRKKWVKKQTPKEEIVKKKALKKEPKKKQTKKKGKKKMNYKYSLSPETEMKMINILHAKEGECRNIIGEPKDMIVCGNKTVYGKSYCSHHCAINFCTKDRN